MAKTKVTRSRKRKSKAVNSEPEEEINTTTAERPHETVAPSEETRTEESDTFNGKEMEIHQTMKDAGDKDDSQMDIIIKGNTPTVTVSLDKTEDVNGEDAENGANASDQMTVEETGRVNGKRKAEAPVETVAETSPSKKTKLINDGFCLFVGNLNSSKTSEEVKASLANYLMTQSLLVQDIRLDRSKKHAYVDLASEMDLTKALTFNGEMMLDKPMRIAKAKVKSAEKVKASPLDKKVAKNARCLFVKNVPYNVTKADILKTFGQAIDVRFPGGTENPEKGIAFLEFKSEAIATKVKQKKQGVKMQGRVLIVHSVGESPVPKASKTTNDKNNNTTAAPPPNNILFVSNLPFNVREKNLEKVFKKAVAINIPQIKGKARGYAFLEFADMAEAEKALKSSKNMKISKRPIRVQFCEMKEKHEKGKVLTKTLIVMGLAETTTAETLGKAFEGAAGVRVATDKVTGVSKRFGFVEFESEEHCKAVKEAMEDCEIDGSKVTVDYARSKIERSCTAATGGSAMPPGAQPEKGGAGKVRKRKRRGKGRGAGKTQDGIKEVENKA